MDENVKKNLKKLAQETEIRAARSILRWKYKKEGKAVPVDHQLENDSRKVAAEAHEIVAKTGKNIWNELKRVYIKGDGKKGNSNK